jgi:lipoprotein-anchoring transpeptidase ErfK/SrfK
VLCQDDRILHEYPVSTAINGPGEGFGSGCTPRGLHAIRIKIGMDQPVNAVFVGRRPTGEIYSAGLAGEYPERDWILTRILWLTGRESGRNRGGDRDTLRRYIYIHGTPDSEPMGEPRSHGCIRMRNEDLVELFELVDTGAIVDIRE